MILRSVIIFVFFPLLAFAKIVDIKHMAEINKYISNDTYVVFDIDNTLVEPTQLLGSDQWFYSRLSELKTKGLDKTAAVEKALNEWIAVQHITKVQLIEKNTAKIIDGLQKRGLFVFCLTTRHREMALCTFGQLKKLGLDFRNSSPTKEKELLIDVDSQLHYKDGVIYTSGGHKGAAFIKFMDAIGHKPAKVIFINDNMKPLKEVEEYSEKRGVDFIGLRYGYLDEKVKQFSKETSDVQFKKFSELISDNDAREICTRKEKKG